MPLLLVFSLALRCEATGSQQAVELTVGELKAAMLGTFPTVQAAFAEMDASPDDIDAALDEEPLDVHEFVRGAASFQPALSKERAAFAFHALDSDGDGLVEKAELLRAVDRGDYEKTSTLTATSTRAPLETSTTRTTKSTTVPVASAPSPQTSIRSDQASTTPTPPDLPPPQIFHYLEASDDELPDDASDDQLLAAFWRRFHEETGIALTWRQWPHYDFGLLDPNRDNSSTPQEFIKATGHFKKPFSKVQAEGIFTQLDANHDGHVEVREFESAIRDGHPGKQHHPLITHVDYTQRLTTARGSVGLSLHVDEVKVSDMSPFVQTTFLRIVAMGIADAVDISTDWVMDLQGHKGAVTLTPASSSGDVTERRLLGEAAPTLDIQACVKLRPGTSPEELLAAVNLGRDQLVKDLSQVPSIRLAHGGDLAPEALQYSTFRSPATSFWFGDADGDGHLSMPEFSSATAEFAKPLSEAEISFAFQGLDADYDGKLSLTEYSGRAGDGRFVTPPYMGRRIAMEDFKARMASAYWTAQDAFDAMLEDPADLQQFTQVVGTFRPPLTKEQAEFAFQGFDADHDGLLVNTEFLEVLKFGDFFPKVVQLQAMLAAVQGRTWFVGYEPFPESFKDVCSIVLVTAGVFFLGYFARSLALGVRLPAAVGVALASAAAVYFGFAPGEVVSGGRAMRDSLMEPVEFLLLFAVGLNLSVADMRGSALTLALVPSSLELAALTVYAVSALNVSIPQGVMLGMVLCGTGDSSVVARMHELGTGDFFGHPSPRLVASWVPMEACFVLLLWSSSSGLLAEAAAHHPDYITLVLVGCFRAAMTVAAGAVIGYVTGTLMSVRSQATAFGRPVFTNAPEEAACLTLAVAAAAFRLAELSTEGWMGLVGLASQPSVQPQLVALVIGAALAKSMSAKDLEAVDGAVGGLWSLGQLALFTLLGADIGHAPFSLAGVTKVLPLMGFGLAARLVGFIFVSTLRSSTCSCDQCKRTSTSSICSDAGLHFVASMQRTTLQAYLGSSPATLTAAMGALADPSMTSLTVLAAQVYVVVLSSAGALLLHIVAPLLLAEPGHCEAAVALEERLTVEGWTARQRMMSGTSAVLPRKYFRIGLLSENGAVIESHACPALPLKETVMKLAKAYSVDARIFATLVQKHAEGNVDSEDASPESSLLGSSVPAGYASVRQMNMIANESSADASQTWRSGLGAVGSGGVLAFMKSKTTIRRLAQERLLTPRAYLEADGLVAMTSEGPPPLAAGHLRL